MIAKFGIYFFNTQLGKDVIDERHDKFIGTAALSSPVIVDESADLIMVAESLLKAGFYHAGQVCV